MSVLEIGNAGLFLKEQLRIIEPGIMETEYPELWGANGKYHTVTTGLPFGANEIFYARVDRVGRAVNFGGKATDIPLVNAGIDTDSNITLMGVLGAEWDWSKLKQQEMAMESGSFNFSVNYIDQYLAALNRGLDEWVHMRTLWGDPSIGFQGLFTNADVEIIEITDNLYSLTANELYDFFVDESFRFQKETKLTGQATDLLIPPDLMRALMKRFTENSDGNVSTLLVGNPNVNQRASFRTINDVNELSYSYLVENGVIEASDNQDMFLLYENTDQVLDKLYSGIFRTPVGLMDDQMTYRTTGVTKISEVRAKRPYKIKYYRFPKKV
jgi:hypothetical protein